MYAPRVARAESTATPGTEALFVEFAKILSASRERTVEAIEECAALLTQMREQFRELLRERREDGLVARFLFENRDRAEGVLGESVEAFYGACFEGDVSVGYAIVARSYLESGFFEEAEGALDEALAHRAGDAALGRDRSFARGMSCFRRGEYAAALGALEEWVATSVPTSERGQRALAQSALEGIPNLLRASDGADLAPRAQALAASLGGD